MRMLALGIASCTSRTNDHFSGPELRLTAPRLCGYARASQTCLHPRNWAFVQGPGGWIIVAGLVAGERGLGRPSGHGGVARGLTRQRRSNPVGATTELARAPVNSGFLRM